MSSTPDRLQLACAGVRRLASSLRQFHYQLAGETLTAVDGVEQGLSAAPADERDAAALLLADVAERAWQTAVRLLPPIPGIH